MLDAREPRPKKGGRATKRRAIIDAARSVFARDGYARASIDAIAAEAAVSTRTIYNHFEGKEDLFSAVLQTSAAEVADGFAERVERELTGSDPVADLVALGRAFAAQGVDFPQHFALVGQIKAEAAHFPPATIAAWQDAGPLRVQHEVARRLQDLADRGLLRHAPEALRTLHFIALVTAGTAVRPVGSPPPTPKETDEAVAAGVAAFLNGYGTRPDGRCGDEAT